MLKLFTVALAFLFLIPVLSEAVTVENAPRFCNAADLAFKKHTAMNLGKDYEPAHAKANPGNAIWAILLAGYSTVACQFPIAGDSVIVNIQIADGLKQFRSLAVDSDEYHWTELNTITMRHIKPTGNFRIAIILELPDSVSLHDSKFLIQLPFLAYEKSTESLLTP